MATFSALTLLLAFGLLAGPHGSYAFAAMRAGPLPAWRAGWCWPGADRRRVEGRA